LRNIVHSDFRGNPELGERSEAVSNRRNRQVVLTIDGAVDDMDVFDVATALTGDERELWTVDDAGGL
jgi:hypothetical protein